VNQQAFNFDPSARKHKGNPASVAAHERVKHTKQDTYQRILSRLQVLGSHGATSKELAAVQGVPVHYISGRLSEMKALKLIEENGSRRDGAAVLVINRCS
jgi:hypothetical protein